MNYHVSLDSDKIQLEWRKLDNIIEEKLKNVLAKIEESDKNSSWYSVLNKIYDTEDPDIIAEILITQMDIIINSIAPSKKYNVSIDTLNGLIKT